MEEDTKERLTLRLSPITKYRFYKAQKSSDCRSMNELAEQAIRFCLDYLKSSHAGDFLSTVSAQPASSPTTTFRKSKIAPQ